LFDGPKPTVGCSANGRRRRIRRRRRKKKKKKKKKEEEEEEGMLNDYIVVILNNESRGLILPLHFRCKVKRHTVKAQHHLKTSRIVHPKTRHSIPEDPNC